MAMFLSEIYKGGKVYSLAYETGHEDSHYQEIELFGETYASWEKACNALAKIDPDDYIGLKIITLVLDPSRT